MTSTSQEMNPDAENFVKMSSLGQGEGQPFKKCYDMAMSHDHPDPDHLASFQSPAAEETNKEISRKKDQKFAPTSQLYANDFYKMLHPKNVKISDRKFKKRGQKWDLKKKSSISDKNPVELASSHDQSLSLKSTEASEQDSFYKNELETSDLKFKNFGSTSAGLEDGQKKVKNDKNLQNSDQPWNLASGHVRDLYNIDLNGDLIKRCQGTKNCPCCLCYELTMKEDTSSGSEPEIDILDTVLFAGPTVKEPLDIKNFRKFPPNPPKGEISSSSSSDLNSNSECDFRYFEAEKKPSLKRKVWSTLSLIMTGFRQLFTMDFRHKKCKKCQKCQVRPYFKDNNVNLKDPENPHISSSESSHNSESDD